jgi:hypothetical protein
VLYSPRWVARASSRFVYDFTRFHLVHAFFDLLFKFVVEWRSKWVGM